MRRFSRDYQKSRIIKDEEIQEIPSRGEARRWKTTLRQLLDLFLFAGVVAAWTYFLLFSRFFVVSIVTISGLEHSKERELKQAVEMQELAPRFFVFSQKNTFLFNVKELKKTINSKYVLDELTVSKKFPNEIEIILKEKISTIVWQKGDQKFLVDLKGIAFQQLDDKTPQEVYKQYPKVDDQTDQQIVLGAEVAPKEVIDEVVELERDLPERLFIRPQGFTYVSLMPLELDIKTNEGWVLKVEPKEEVSSELERLNLLFSQKFHDRKKLEYIDLRFGDKVFYKER